MPALSLCLIDFFFVPYYICIFVRSVLFVHLPTPVDPYWVPMRVECASCCVMTWGVCMPLVWLGATCLLRKPRQTKCAKAFNICSLICFTSVILAGIITVAVIASIRPLAREGDYCDDDWDCS